MGRSRKRRNPSTPRAPRKPAAERDAEVRAQLEPLQAGERPGAVTVAAIVAAVLAISNVVLVAVGFEVSDETSGGGPGGAILFAVILLAAAGGMWQSKYWAVLGFQALLGATILFAFLALLVAANVWGVVVPLVVMGLAGTLFWKLIRAMARIQMPKRPGT